MTRGHCIRMYWHGCPCRVLSDRLSSGGERLPLAATGVDLPSAPNGATPETSQSSRDGAADKFDQRSRGPLPALESACGRP